MSAFPFSVSLVVPASDQADANRLAAALGWDVLPGNTFSFALSSDGTAPATHFGCHAWAGPGFVSTIQNAQGGALPEIDWSAYGLTAERVTALLSAMQSSIQTGSVGFWALLSDGDLQTVQAEAI